MNSLRTLYLLVSYCLLQFLSISTTQAFISERNRYNTPINTPTRDTTLKCICINCSKVVNCQAYHFVETKHEQPHMNSNPTFRPREGSPSIDVHIRTSRNEAERARMRDEMEQQEKLFLKSDEEVGKESKSFPSAYEISSVFTEYDVVACEDFEEDIGAWVKNMPEEIRLANPDFVPP